MADMAGAVVDVCGLRRRGRTDAVADICGSLDEHGRLHGVRAVARALVISRTSGGARSSTNPIYRVSGMFRGKAREHGNETVNDS
jgi:hypothetical protein